jgi:sigma-B regulation protein RsbU (phosphoserine phosphatase)
VLLRTTLSLSGEVSDVLKHVSSHLIASCPAPISASLFLGLFDSSTGVLDYVNVGHPEPIIAHLRTGFKSLGSSEGTLLGSADLRVPARHEPIPQGATTVVVSRGILEARSPDKGKFGLERLTNVLRMTASRSARAIGDSILRAVKDFQRRIAQTEDFSIIVLSRR